MTIYSSQRARRSLFSTVVFRAASQVATLLSYVVLVREMEEQSFGVLALFYSVIPVIATFASFGLEQTLRRFQPEYLQAGRTDIARWLVKFVARTRFAVTIAVIALILLGWNLVAPFLQLAAYRTEFAIFGILIVLHFQAAILQYSLSSQMLHHFSAGSLATLGAVKLVAYLTVAHFGELTLDAAIVSDIAAYGLTVIALSAVHYRSTRSTPVAARLDSGERQRVKRYAIFNHFIDAGSMLCYPQVDNFFIVGILGPIAVATYAFYNRLMDMINTIIPNQLLENVVQPMFFAVKSEEADYRVRRYFTFLVNMNVVLLLPALAFSFVYHRELVGLIFGTRYLESSALLPFMVAMMTFANMFAIPLALVAQYYERASLIMISLVFGLYQIAAMFTLIPIFGIFGAAFSTGSFHLLRNAFLWWMLRRRVHWMNAGSTVLTSALIWGTVAALCLALKSLALSSLIDLVVGAVICSLGVVIHLRSGAVLEADREILANVMHGREARLIRWFGLQPRAGV
jgi:O-antigen/teichoic acid export membrane protein